MLQEYFYDDWSKIRLVLGDNQKPEALQFIHQQSVDYPALFGRYYQADDVTSEQQYVLMDNTAAVWNEALAYLAIYAAPEAKQHSQQPSPDNLSQTDTEQSEPASV